MKFRDEQKEGRKENPMTRTQAFSTRVDVSTRMIQHGNFDHPYTEDSFVNADSYDAKDRRMNRAWVIHDAGYVKAIVFAEYWAYCEQDALDVAADSGKLDYLLITEKELEDYRVGEDSEGNPEYEGIASLGNAGEPFDSENLDVFEVAAEVFRLDPVVMKVIEQKSREEAEENLRFAATDSVQIDELDVDD